MRGAASARAVTPFAILLLIVAAFLHASWNVLSKRSHPAPAFLLVANSLGCAVLLPAVVLYGRKLLSRTFGQQGCWAT